MDQTLGRGDFELFQLDRSRVDTRDSKIYIRKATQTLDSDYREFGETREKLIPFEPLTAQDGHDEAKMEAIRIKPGWVAMQDDFIVLQEFQTYFYPVDIKIVTQNGADKVEIIELKDINLLFTPSFAGQEKGRATKFSFNSERVFHPKDLHEYYRVVSTPQPPTFILPEQSQGIEFNAGQIIIDCEDASILDIRLESSGVVIWSSGDIDTSIGILNGGYRRLAISLPVLVAGKYYNLIANISRDTKTSMDASVSFYTLFTIPVFSLSATSIYVNQSVMLDIVPLPGSIKYHVQASYDPLFADEFLINTTVSGTRIVTPVPDLGTLYFRVASESVAGIISEWTDIQHCQILEYPVYLSSISALTVGRGTNTIFSLSVTRPQGGTTEATFSLNAATGITATFAPASIEGLTTQITLSVEATKAPGDYSVSVVITTPQGQTDTKQFVLTVQYGYIEVSQCWLDPDSTFTVDSNGRCSAWENWTGKQSNMRGTRPTANQQPFVSNIAQSKGGIYVPDSEGATAKGFEVHNLTTQVPAVFSWVGSQRFYLYNNILFGNPNFMLMDGFQANWYVKIGTITYLIPKHFTTGGVSYTTMGFSVICLLLTSGKFTVWSSSSKTSATTPSLSAHSGVIPSFSDLYLMTAQTPVDANNSCNGGNVRAFGVSLLPTNTTDQQCLDLYLTPIFNQLRNRFL